MPVTLIRNNTGAALQLIDGGVPIGEPIPQGGSIQQVPITITSVTRGRVTYQHDTGALVDGRSYDATFAAATVTLTDGRNPVTYR